MIKFDYSKIPVRNWTYSSNNGDWDYGVEIYPDRGIIFWGESRDGDDAGSAIMSFQEFFRTTKFNMPDEIINEIRKILESARINK